MSPYFLLNDFVATKTHTQSISYVSMFCFSFCKSFCKCMAFNLGIVWCFVYYLSLSNIAVFPSINFNNMYTIKWVREGEGHYGLKGDATVLPSISLIIFFDHNTNASVSSDIFSLPLSIYMLFNFLHVQRIERLFCGRNHQNRLHELLLDFLRRSLEANPESMYISIVKAFLQSYSESQYTLCVKILNTHKTPAGKMQ